MPEFIWMQHEFPWLGHGFIHAVADDHADVFRRDLERLGFAVAVLQGDRMKTAAGFWDEMSLAFGFPEYFGGNWDAFNDSFGDLEIGGRTAVLWRHADQAAASNLKLFAEGVAALERIAMALSSVDSKQMEVVLTGERGQSSVLRNGLRSTATHRCP